ncbi:hypothetical protein DFH09DRAFT_1103919 [Mycena vulgaris]|nr:hypothetical protein DFH09DRAFT_1103919 [Mycena vulgaris]
MTRGSGRKSKNCQDLRWARCASYRTAYNAIARRLKRLCPEDCIGNLGVIEGPMDPISHFVRHNPVQSMIERTVVPRGERHVPARTIQLHPEQTQLILIPRANPSAEPDTAMRTTLVVLLLASFVSSITTHCDWNFLHGNTVGTVASCCAQFPNDEGCPRLNCFDGCRA